jgi:predicted MFS family arabinose efflux permease
MIYLLPAFAGFILWGLIYFYLPNFPGDKGRFKFNYLAAFKNKIIVYIFTYIFLISLVYHAIQQWLGVYFSTRFGFGQFLISNLITLTSLSGICGEVLGGWFSDSWGRAKTVDLGIFLMLVSIFALIFRLPVAILAMLMIIWGLGWTFNHAGLSTVLTDLPKEFLPEAASLNSSVRFIAGGLGVVLAGIILPRSFTAGFAIFGTCLFGLLVFSKKLIGRHQSGVLT